MSITLAELRQQSRERADMVESEFVTQSEQDSYINNSLAELHDLLIGAFNEDYSMESVEFSTVSNQLDYDLPNGTNYSAAPSFYKLRGVDVKIDEDRWVTVHRFNFNRRNEDQNAYAWNLLGIPYLEYRLVGSTLRFNRVPDQNTSVRVWYHPSAAKLVDATDAYDDVNSYAEYVIVDVAIKMMQKEESDVSILMAQKEALRQRIMDMAQNRDANEPESVTDIYAEQNDYFWVGE